MMKTILVVFAFTAGYAASIIVDVVMVPVYLVSALKNANKEKSE